MRCDELRARLDAAGPGGLTPTQLAHARACEACAAELQAAQAVEAMLRAAPPSPSMTFSATVMSRVEATERARQRLAELPRVPAWQRWLRAVVDEPIAVVALALAPVPILVALFWPGTAANVTNFLRDAMSVWVRTETVAAADPTFVLAAPALRLVVLIGVALFSLGWLEQALNTRTTRRARRGDA